MDKKNFLVLALAISFVGRACPVRQTSEGIVITKEDAYGILGGLAAGGATFLTLRMLQPAALPGRLEQGLLSGAIGVAGGVGAYYLAKYLCKNDHENLENYLTAQRMFDTLNASRLMTVPEAELKDFILEHYGNKTPFGNALRGLKELERLFSDARCGLEEVLEKSKKNRDGKLYNKSKELLEKMQELQVAMSKRKTFITRECGYESMLQHVFETKQQVVDLFSGEQVSAVQDSYEKTLAYGVSSVDELWPLVSVVKALRETIKTAHDLLKNCIAEREICVQKMEGDTRYEPLVQEYSIIIERIKNEFPFGLFEQRIQEIFTSPEYQEQGKMFEEQRRHAEMMTVLNGIGSRLNEDLDKVKETVSRVESELSGTKRKISSLEDNVSRLHWNSSSIRNDLSAIRIGISALQNRPRQQ